ncbi:MAG TPA: sulfite exporter TauE/SafE family protein [Ilumatobacteraceae bacterium]|nr:sulfite exporter TauE/SafE family protein [Ilumatobacteraceae bacterium]
MLAAVAFDLSDNVAYVAAGLLAGLAIGLTGMGGGVVLTPIMVVGLGVPANVAVGNDLIVSLLVKPIGARVHGKAGTVRRDIVRCLVIGSVPAAFLGAMIVGLWLDTGDSLEVIIGIALLVSASMMVVRMLIRSHGEGPSPLHPIPTMAVGIVGGLLVGITSVGSGSLMLVLLTWIYPRLASKTLVGTDLMQAIPLVASAALGHLIFGDIRFSIVLPVLLGAAPGVYFGSRASSRMPNWALRPVLILLVGASGLRLVGVF